MVIILSNGLVMTDPLLEWRLNHSPMNMSHVTAAMPHKTFYAHALLPAWQRLQVLEYELPKSHFAQGLLCLCRTML